MLHLIVIILKANQRGVLVERLRKIHFPHILGFALLVDCLVVVDDDDDDDVVTAGGNRCAWIWTLGLPSSIQTIPRGPEQLQRPVLESPQRRVPRELERE